MSLIASEVNFEIARLLAFDVDGMVRLGIPLDEATAIEAEFVGWNLAADARRRPPKRKIAATAQASPEPVAKPSPKPKKRARHAEATADRRAVTFHAFDGSVTCNLSSSVLESLPFAEEVDLDGFAWLCLPREQLRPFNARGRGAP